MFYARPFSFVFLSSPSFARRVTFFPSCRQIRNKRISRCGYGYFIRSAYHKALHWKNPQLQEKVKKKVIVKEIRFSVTPRQREILTLLSQRQQWTIGEIASLLGVSSAAASKCVDRLERKKLVKRRIDEWDRRNVLVSLTAISQSLLNESSS